MNKILALLTGKAVLLGAKAKGKSYLGIIELSTYPEFEGFGFIDLQKFEILLPISKAAHYYNQIWIRMKPEVTYLGKGKALIQVPGIFNPRKVEIEESNKDNMYISCIAREPDSLSSWWRLELNCYKPNNKVLVVKSWDVTVQEKKQILLWVEEYSRNTSNFKKAFLQDFFDRRKAILSAK